MRSILTHSLALLLGAALLGLPLGWWLAQPGPDSVALEPQSLEIEPEEGENRGSGTPNRGSEGAGPPILEPIKPVRTVAKAPQHRSAVSKFLGRVGRIEVLDSQGQKRGDAPAVLLAGSLPRILVPLRAISGAYSARVFGFSAAGRQINHQQHGDKNSEPAIVRVLIH